MKTGKTPSYIQELFEVKKMLYNLKDPSITIIPKANLKYMASNVLSMKVIQFRIGWQ